MNPATLAAINQALQAFLLQLNEVLVEGAGRAYLKGALLGDARLGIQPDAVSISDDAISFAQGYGELLRAEGASVISGEKVPWLRDMDSEQRARIDEIIEEGLREGRATGIKESGVGTYPKGSIAEQLQEYFSERKSHASTVARTETARIQNKGQLERWQKREIEEVEVLDDEGPNSCQECAMANGQRWTLEYAMAHELEHPNCVRAFNPVPNGIAL